MRSAVNFKDHFSGQASDYALYRPSYPPELFEFLASLCAEREAAWDCGTGNGQAAIRLADFFQKVMATDPSQKQIRNAFPYPRVVYQIAAAEKTGIAGGSIDLITVAQAIHWFDFDQFYAEANRVLKPGGILAVWCYYLPRISPEIDAAIDDFYTHTVGSYWPPERKWVDDRYRSLPFPFVEIQAPQFYMKTDWSLENLAGYISTWSAVQQFIAAKRYNPLDEFGSKLHSLWGDEEKKAAVKWPFYLRVGKL